MAITLPDIYSAREKYREVGSVYDFALNAFVQSLVETAQYEAEPGIFAKRRHKRLVDEAIKAAIWFQATYKLNVSDYVEGDHDGLTICNHMLERALAIVGPEERHSEFCREAGISPDTTTVTPRPTNRGCG